MRKTIIIFTFVVILLTGCGVILPVSTGGSDGTTLPTPTSHLYFSGSEGEVRLIPVDPVVQAGGGAPTVAPHFSLQPTETPRANSAGTGVPGAPASSPQDTSPTATIYDDVPNPNWRVLRSLDMQVDIVSRETEHSGNYSIAMQPKSGFNLLYFAVSEDSQVEYPRQDVMGIGFWLYSPESVIGLDDLAVTVVGSNAYPYWLPGDDSVTNIISPTFSETRLNYLGLNTDIPPDTWAYVEVLIDERIYDPEYKYVTGFYIKNNLDFTEKILVDDVQLLYYNDRAKVTPDALEPVRTPEPYLPVIVFQVDAERDKHPISPLIYGISDAGPEYLDQLRPALTSWGGNPSTRFNWELGNAWNAGRDYFFRNGNYGVTEGSASDEFISATLKSGAAVRLTLPTLGWVAKNDDLNTCSFPTGDGGCKDARGATCEIPFLETDPNLANVPSDTEFVADWLRHLTNEMDFDLRFLAMDNEPELWGFTHYDVHPTCTSYQEVLDKFIEYATVAREVVPTAEIAGPVTSSWYYYWNSAAGGGDRMQHDNQPFLEWFLDQVREYDKENKTRTLDVLDIHYYPEGLFNQVADRETAAFRLRSTRTLWDRSYKSETWIAEPIYLIPRMQELIEEHYPGTKLGISEWNFGADETMNGALAIADVLGIFGREDLYYAAYYGGPTLDSPGFQAFRMYTNFDNRGSRFGDTSVWSHSSEGDLMSGYAALDSDSGNMYLMLINKQPKSDATVNVSLKNFVPVEEAVQFQYTENQPKSVTKSGFSGAAPAFRITLPAYSITLLILEPAK